MSGEHIEVEGVVREYARNVAIVECEIAGRSIQVQAHRSGKLKQNYIRLLVGDHVTVKVSAHDMSRGIVVYRH